MADGVDEPEELIRVEALTHRFHDGVLGLDRVSLSVRRGDFLVLAGRNGSGKTLLMRHLIGLVRPSAGSILYMGTEIGKDLRKVRTGIGLVFQDSEAQIIGQTVREDVAFGPSNLGLSLPEIEGHTKKALSLLHLEDKGDRIPDGLSGGERRRLAIAGIMAMDPDCVILDEPFANLDLPSIRQVLSAMTELHAEGRTVIVLTHELEKVLAHATRLVVMEAGSIVYDGDPEPADRSLFSENGLADPYRFATRRADLTWLR